MYSIFYEITDVRFRKNKKKLDTHIELEFDFWDFEIRWSDYFVGFPNWISRHRMYKIIRFCGVQTKKIRPLRWNVRNRCFCVCALCWRWEKSGFSDFKINFYTCPYVRLWNYLIITFLLIWQRPVKCRLALTGHCETRLKWNYLMMLKYGRTEYGRRRSC